MSIWQDELQLLRLDQDKGRKRTELAQTDLKLDRKEFKNKNEGEKAKFVIEEELKALDKTEHYRSY